MNEFIYILRPTRPAMLRTATPREKDVVSRHFAYLKDLCEKRIVAIAGRTTRDDEHTFGVCVLRAESEAAAESLMRADPAVAEGVMSAALYPFRVAVLSHPESN